VWWSAVKEPVAALCCALQFDDESIPQPLCTPFYFSLATLFLGSTLFRLQMDDSKLGWLTGIDPLGAESRGTIWVISVRFNIPFTINWRSARPFLFTG
jgi:hypothetical protein